MKRILILCTGNSCRSQMAESIIRKKLPNVEVFSAGVKPASAVASKSIIVLLEKGYETQTLYPKDVSVFNGEVFDIVVTVCNNAQERCPYFPGARKQIHVPFDDPYEAVGTDQEVLNVYRRVRDEIEQWVSTFQL